MRLGLLTLLVFNQNRFKAICQTCIFTPQLLFSKLDTQYRPDFMLLIALSSSKSTDILPPWHACIIKVRNFLLSYCPVFTYSNMSRLVPLLTPLRAGFSGNYHFLLSHLKKKTTKAKVFLLLQAAPPGMHCCLAGSFSTFKPQMPPFWHYCFSLQLPPWWSTQRALSTDCFLHKSDTLGNKTILSFYKKL